MKLKYHQIRIVLILLPLSLLLFLLNKQFPLNGQLILIYDFKQPSAFITKLSPEDRVEPIQQSNGEYYQTLKDDSVYFNIELPTNYEKAIISLQYQSDPDTEIKIGGLVNRELWQWQFVSLEKSVKIYNGWYTGRAVLNLAMLDKKDQRLKMMVLTPDLIKNNIKVKIHNIKVILQTTPWPIKLYRKMF